MAKMPARKKRCLHCAEIIFVKSLPDDRAKRLMTEAQAKAAEDAWEKYCRENSVRRRAMAALPVFGLSREYLDHVLKNTGWTAAVAMEAILSAVARDHRRTRHQRKGAHLLLARMLIEARDTRWREHMEQSIREELAEWEGRGALAVQIRKPRPWEPALEMLEMRAAGASVDDIAKATGYSVITVTRNLETRGNDPRTGPHCDRHAGRIFSFAQALDVMPLPCGETCVCSWSPVLVSDFAPIVQTK